MTNTIGLIIIILVSFVMGCLTSNAFHTVQMEKLLKDASIAESYAYCRGFSEGCEFGRKKQSEENND